jgi:hypothetical protein
MSFFAKKLPSLPFPFILLLFTIKINWDTGQLFFQDWLCFKINPYSEDQIEDQILIPEIASLFQDQTPPGIKPLSELRLPSRLEKYPSTDRPYSDHPED